MKNSRLSIIIITLLISTNFYAQHSNSDTLQPYFNAIIVKDMNTSVDWYTENLVLDIVSKSDFSNEYFKQVNLKRDAILIELIELKSALIPEDVIPNYTTKTRTIGLFKFGFLTSNFAEWVSNLKSNGVTFHGEIVIDQLSKKRMVIIKDPDGNRIQLFEK